MGFFFKKKPKQNVENKPAEGDFKLTFTPAPGSDFEVIDNMIEHNEIQENKERYTNNQYSQNSQYSQKIEENENKQNYSTEQQRTEEAYNDEQDDNVANYSQNNNFHEVRYMEQKKQKINNDPKIEYLTQQYYAGEISLHKYLFLKKKIEENNEDTYENY